MLFKYKNIIKELTKDLSFWQKSCNELQEDIDELKKENKLLKDTNIQLNNQLIDIKKLSQENEIMRKYYKLDKEPSIEVQAKVLADLRIHDMEYQQLKEKIDKIQTMQYRNSLLLMTNHLPYYY